MKKNLLLISATLISAIAMAQPTLSSTNTNPVIGDQFTLQAGPWVSQGSAGASQTWNFASVTPTNNATYTVSAVSAPNAAVFTNANLQQDGTGGASGFFKGSSTAYQNYGSKTGTVNIVYSNPEDMMQYPFTMSGTYNDYFSAQFVSSGYTFYRKGTTTNTADAYGTITLPNGTFSNALRVHYVQNYKDSTNIGMAYEFFYLNDMYMWYLPNNHQPIFSTYSLTISGATSNTSSGSNLLQTISNSLVEEATGIKSMNFYPNPTSGSVIHLDLNLSENINYNVVLVDNLGREVFKSSENKGFQGYNAETLDVSNLADGLYNFVIQSEGKNLMTKRIVVRK